MTEKSRVKQLLEKAFAGPFLAHVHSVAALSGLSARQVCACRIGHILHSGGMTHEEARYLDPFLDEMFRPKRESVADLPCVLQSLQWDIDSFGRKSSRLELIVGAPDMAFFDAASDAAHSGGNLTVQLLTERKP